VSASNEEVASEIRAIVADARIDCAGPALLMPAGLANDNLADVLPDLPRTNLQEGVARTVAWYREAASR
jgi:hypothetical protein